jgi:hypothetical protein
MAKKTPKQTASPSGLRLIPQPNGKGALLAGGKPGNKGGTGRPPSAIRAQMRGSLAERISIAEAIADDKDAKASDRLHALDLLAKYGLGTTSTETDTEGNDVLVRVRREPRRAVG